MGRVRIWHALCRWSCLLLLLIPVGIGTASLAPHPANPTLVPSHTPIGPWDPLKGDPSAGVPRFSVTNAQLTPGGCCWGGGSSTPVWLAYDSADAAFWVATTADTVAVVLASQTDQVSASVPVGSQPFGVAADPTDHEVFVTNTGSDNVSVVSDASQLPLASVGVGSSPMGVAYDPADREIFVVNQGSANVSVISASTLSVVATVPVGLQPLGIVYDPATGRVFVADEGSDLIQSISPVSDTVVANFTVGAGPYGIAIDNATDDLYVTNSGSGNISVVNASTGANVADISIGGLQYTLSLAGIAYDADTHQVWVGAGSSYLIVLNTTEEAVAWVYTWDPTGVAYDPVDGLICLTNTANATFECLSYAVGQYSPLVSFQETGLPTGTHWSVDAGSGVASSAASEIAIGVCGGGPSCTDSISYTIEPVAGYLPTPSSGTTGSVNGPLNLSIVFSGAATYALAFTESGLASGTAWSVQVNATTRVSSGASISFQEPNGSYSFEVSAIPGYSASVNAGTVVVAGAPVGVPVTFVPVGYLVVITERGLPAGANWTLWFNGSLYPGASPNRTLVVPDGRYNFFGLGTTVGGAVYSPSNLFDSIRVNGSGVNATVSYLLSGYYVEFNETGLPSTARWSIQVGGYGFGGSGNATFVLPNGSYAFEIAPPPGYTALPSSGVVEVNGGPASQAIRFVTNSSAPPAPLAASFTYRIVSEGCLSGGGVTNTVSLTGAATGGTPPYLFRWSLPNGTAQGANANATLTYGQSTTLSLNVTDSTGEWATRSAVLSMVLPPCPPPPPVNTVVVATTSPIPWVVILSAAVVVVGASAVGLWFLRRQSRS